MIPDLERLVPAALAERLVALRHDLHRHPELAFKEERTAGRLAEALAPATEPPTEAATEAPTETATEAPTEPAAATEAPATQPAVEGATVSFASDILPILLGFVRRHGSRYSGFR